VTRDVPPFAIVAGVPARVIRYRFSTGQIERLPALAWWNWTHEALASALPDFDARSSTNSSTATNRCVRARRAFVKAQLMRVA